MKKEREKRKHWQKKNKKKGRIKKKKQKQKKKKKKISYRKKKKKTYRCFIKHRFPIELSVLRSADKWAALPRRKLNGSLAIRWDCWTPLIRR